MKENIVQVPQTISQESTQQYLWIDLAKILSIFGVIYIHSNGFLSTYFRFGVPLFISISFFLSERSFIKREIKVSKFLRKRILRLAIPFFFWSFFYFFISQPSYHGSLSKIVTKYWTGFGWSGQYYLIILIFLNLLYPWLRKVRVTLTSLLFIAFFTIIFLYILFNYLKLSSLVTRLNVVPVFYWIFYLYLGIYSARNYEDIQTSLTVVKPAYKLVFLLTIPFLISIENAAAIDIGFARESYFRVSTILVSAVVFFLFLSLEDNLKNKLNASGHILSWLSSWTLGIYCLNPFFIDLLRGRLLNSDNSTANELLLSMLNCSLIYAFCLICSYLIFRVKGGILVR